MPIKAVIPHFPPDTAGEDGESCSCEKWETGSWGQGQFGNVEEEQCPPWQATAKQWLVETEKTLCVL
jgi:hypothetical protein